MSLIKILFLKVRCPTHRPPRARGWNAISLFAPTFRRPAYDPVRRRLTSRRQFSIRLTKVPAAPPNASHAASFLAGYPPSLVEPVRELAAAGRLSEVLRQRHPRVHDVRTDKALYDYVQAIRNDCLRNAPPLAKVIYDNRLQVVAQALGTHTRIARVQGSKLKSKNEIRIAAVFRDMPEALLRMIVVHELAHLRLREHDKDFYKLCCHMEPAYHQLEFDARVWLFWRDMAERSKPVAR